MQWDKFSTDSDESMRKLETELLAAAVDHINDKRYFTHAPLGVEAKPDYFTPGVRLLVSFDKIADDEHEAVVNLSVPGSSQGSIDESVPPHRSERTFVATYSVSGSEKSKSLNITRGVRVSVGRTRENGLAIDDPSVSKIHASLTVDDSGKLIVADTGSTNGTFVNGQRIAYGKAIVVGDGGKVMFGVIDVFFQPEHIPMPGESFAVPVNSNGSATAPGSAAPATNIKSEDRRIDDEFPAPTQPSIGVEPAPTEPAIDIEPVKTSSEGEELT
jgi:pSer/pThr/pTyr-binding forkhead associated (FHA) protein